MWIVDGLTDHTCCVACPLLDIVTSDIVPESTGQKAALKSFVSLIRRPAVLVIFPASEICQLEQIQFVTRKSSQLAFVNHFYHSNIVSSSNSDECDAEENDDQET